MTVTKTADVVRLGLSDAYDEFRSRVAEKYYKQYHDVIRKYDRNHLIFGSRLHSNGKYDRQTLQACAKYCDVVTINYYGVWTPEADFLEEFRSWTGDRPFFVTEFYVKGEDANYDGTPYNDAFTSTADNNCNRGLVSAKFYPWLGFLEGVGRLNRNVYAVMDRFDK